MDEHIHDAAQIAELEAQLRAIYSPTTATPVPAGPKVPLAMKLGMAVASAVLGGKAAAKVTSGAVKVALSNAKQGYTAGALLGGNPELLAVWLALSPEEKVAMIARAKGETA